MLGVGLHAAWKEKRHKSGTAEFFLGGRSLPSWVLAISLVASSLSVATFVGVPDQAFKGNLTYLVLYLGNFLAAVIVGLVFVPRLYRAGTVTIYGYLATRFGERSRVAVSITFLFGRMLASGARLMLAAVPLVMLIRDVPANQVTVGADGACDHRDRRRRHILRGLRWHPHRRMGRRGAVRAGGRGGAAHDRAAAQPHSRAAGRAVCQAARREEAGRLRHLARRHAPYTVWTALTGGLLTAMATFGVDHDFAQRFLVAKSPGRGALSVIASQFIGIAVVSLFLLIGLLLYVFYNRPDIMGCHASLPAPARGAGCGRRINGF